MQDGGIEVLSTRRHPDLDVPVTRVMEARVLRRESACTNGERGLVRVLDFGLLALDGDLLANREADLQPCLRRTK